MGGSFPGERKRIVILGSTGSIGRSTVDVVLNHADRVEAIGLVARRNVKLLYQQAVLLRPRWVAVVDPQAADQVGQYRWPSETTVLRGPESVLRMVAEPDVDIVVSAIVGRAGLDGTWAAVEAGKTVALANKETLVMAGQLVMKLARQKQSQILPVDSEHSAIFQALQCGRRHELQRVILTASGGPFRELPAERLAEVTVAEALNHPTWKMGKKVTIDSATLMNKALEIIEARWLFDLQADQISVLIHPQSIVHSLVEFLDGSIIAQLSCPDMRLPIQYALSWPERWPAVAPRLDWASVSALQFEVPDLERFPAIKLGLEVARMGGTAGAVLNAANEAAVEAFLAGRIRFDEIVPACQAVLQQHNFDPQPSLEDLLKLDRWAREEIHRWVCT